MDIAVSIIMPSLNVVNYIEESITSVLNQTLTNIEVICVDAGSTDGTLEIIKRLSTCDNRIILLHSNKKSYGYQVNRGLEIATGEYIAVVETDDFIGPDMYFELYEKAKRLDVDIIKSDYYAYWTQDNEEKFFLDRKNFIDIDLYNTIIEPKRYAHIATDDWYLWTGIYKRKLLIDHNILLSETNGAAFQDIGFIHRTNVAAKRAYYIQKKYYRYCIDRADSSSNSGKGLLYSYYEFQSLYNEFKNGDKDILIALYGRMAKSFTCCCFELDAQYISSNESYRVAFNWFCLRLTEAIKTGVIGEFNIHPGIWDNVQIMITSFEDFTKKRNERFEIIESKLQNKSIIIFGCGNYGYTAYQWALKRGIRVAAFMDNNSSLWGTFINNIEIVNPNRICSYGEDYIFLVANEKYCKEMAEQLKENGVVEDYIIRYKL